MSANNVAENQNFNSMTQVVFAFLASTINLMQIGVFLLMRHLFAKILQQWLYVCRSFFRSHKRASRLLSWSSQWSPRSTRNCSARADLNNCQTKEKQASVNHHVRWGIETEKIIKNRHCSVKYKNNHRTGFSARFFFQFSLTSQATSIFVVAYTRIHVLWNFPSERRVGGKFTLKIRENPLNLCMFARGLNWKRINQFIPRPV